MASKLNLGSNDTPLSQHDSQAPRDSLLEPERMSLHELVETTRQDLSSGAVETEKAALHMLLHAAHNESLGEDVDYVGVCMQKLIRHLHSQSAAGWNHAFAIRPMLFPIPTNNVGNGQPEVRVWPLITKEPPSLEALCKALKAMTSFSRAEPVMPTAERLNYYARVNLLKALAVYFERSTFSQCNAEEGLSVDYAKAAQALEDLQFLPGEYRENPLEKASTRGSRGTVFQAENLSKFQERIVLWFKMKAGKKLAAEL